MFEAERMMIVKGYAIEYPSGFYGNYDYLCFCNREKNRKIECYVDGVIASTFSTNDPEPIEIELQELECIINAINELRKGTDIGTTIWKELKGWRIYHLSGQYLELEFEDEHLLGDKRIRIDRNGNCVSSEELSAAEMDRIKVIAALALEYRGKIVYKTVDYTWFLS